MYGFTNICKYIFTKFLSIETSTDNNEPLRGTEERPKNKILLILDKLVRPQTPISQHQHRSGFTPEDSGRTGRHQRNNPWQIHPCFFFFCSGKWIKQIFSTERPHACVFVARDAGLFEKGKSWRPCAIQAIYFSVLEKAVPTIGVRLLSYE